MKKILYFMIDLTWVGLFIIGLQTFVLWGWSFNIVSGEDWTSLGRAWQEGKFVVDNAPKLFFVLILFFSPFLLLLGLWLINKINFEKIPVGKIKTIKLKKRKTEEQVIKELEAKTNTTLDIRPNAVGKIPQEVGEMSQDKKQQLKLQQEENAVVEQVAKVEEETQTQARPQAQSQEKTKTPEEVNTPAQVNKDILKALQEKGYTILKEVTLGENIIDFLAIAKERIILIGIDEEKGDWIANEDKEEDKEYPEWFFDSAKRESPVNMIMESYVELYPMLKQALGDDDFPINVVLVIACANIVNIKDIKADWADIGASVVRHKSSTDNVPKSLEMFGGILPNESKNPAPDERVAKIKDILAQ
jgi:hypothetical protein